MPGASVETEKRQANTMLSWHYIFGQGLVALLRVHGFPRLLA